MHTGLLKRLKVSFSSTFKHQVNYVFVIFMRPRGNPAENYEFFSKPKYLMRSHTALNFRILRKNTRWKLISLLFHCLRVNLFASSEKFHQRTREIFKYRNAIVSTEDPSQVLSRRSRVIRDLWWKSQIYLQNSLPSETTRTLQELFGQINIIF